MPWFEIVVPDANWDGREVRLPPKVFELLVIVVERRGLLVEKDDLMKALWPDMFVEEITLTGNISPLRKARGDAPGQDESLQTASADAALLMLDVNDPHRHQCAWKNPSSPHANRTAQEPRPVEAAEPVIHA